MKISKSFVFLWCQPSSNKLKMNSTCIWIDNSCFRDKIRVSLDEVYNFCRNEKGFKAKFAFVKMWHANEWKLSYFEFDRFTNSPTNYCFCDTYLIVSYQKGEENCLLDVPILTRELYIFTRKDLCFGTCREVVYKMFIVWIIVNSVWSLSKKMISPVIFDPDYSIKWKNAVCLMKKIVYQSFFGAPLMLS